MTNDTINFITIILSVLLVGAIILQVKGTGSGLFGSAYSSFRTRRGFERLLFRFTIALAGTFIVVAIISARIQ